MTSWADARGAIVRMVAGAQCAGYMGGGTHPVHNERGAEDKFGEPRSFWLRANGGRTQGPHVQTPQIVIVDVELIVEYPADDNTADLDVVVVDDARAISRRLADSSLWEQDRSGIVSMGAADADSLFAFTVVDETDGRRVRFLFPIEVTCD